MQRIKNKKLPKAYRAGVCYFCELPFFANKHILIPRNDTETLVETVIKSKKLINAGCSVLDLCTGSGCIAVVLAKHGFQVVASDISRRALSVARKNAILNDVKVNFICSNLFESISKKTDFQFDAIVCNPPYIKTVEIGLQDGTVLFEPRLALDGGADGLEFYRKIAREAKRFLKVGGMLIFEIGFNQGSDVKSILQNNGYRDIEIIKDMAGNNRVIKCLKS